MEKLIKLLHCNNPLFNIQLIQTTSILVQNVKTQAHLYYIFAHPFLNELIQYQHDWKHPHHGEETLAPFVSFLKAMTLQLNDETINFFFNDKFRTFPLFHEAVKFYNHSNHMIRTAIRTVTLKIFSIQNPQMQQLFSGLPYCSYFAHLACFLKEHWKRMDEHLMSMMADEKTVAKHCEGVVFETEDANEMLFYFEDLLSQSSEEICTMLTNALLKYAYLPTVVKSLCHI